MQRQNTTKCPTPLDKRYLLTFAKDKICKDKTLLNMSDTPGQEVTTHICNQTGYVILNTY